MANESEFDSNVKFKGGEGGVTVGLRRNNVPWWIVLLLLPLLLLIKCNKEITVTCTDCENGSVVSGQPVTLEYTPRFIYDDGKFFPDSAVVRTVATDDKGTAVFDSLRCSVFSYIFYCLSEVKISAENECFTGGAVRNFHFTQHVDICLDPKRIDLHIKIIDAEKGYVLPDAELKYTYIKDGEPVTETVKADAAGEVTIPGMRFCSSLQLLEASCYGYENCVKHDEPCQNHVVADDYSAMRLKPIKKRVEFFVKDKDTKQPIPAAEATVTFTLPDGSKDVRTVHTSIDGRGVAFCDDAFILADIAIHATKEGFGDGDLQGGPWRVDKFIVQDEDTRTILLDRLPIAVEFRDVDKNTRKPIPGVTNKITVTAPDGTTSVYTEISNSNGVFVVRAIPGSKIEIAATKSPGYKPAHHVVGSFQNKGEDVLLEPVPPPIAYDYSGKNVSHTKCYDLYGAPVTFTFSWNLCMYCTMIVIKDDKGNVIDTFGYDDVNHTQVNNAKDRGTKKITSPTRHICVTVQDVNGHNAEYHIRLN